MSGDIDLSELQLLPQWAKEPLEHNPYQNHEGETASPRDRRGGRDDRGRGGPGRRPGGGSQGRDSQRPPQNRGPRPDGGRGQGPRSSDSRPGGPRRDQGGNRQGFRPNRDDRQERPPEVLPALEALFQPEPHGADSMVKQIKSSGRAYPVFELARMILKKPERHQVLVQPAPGQTPETALKLFLCAPDQSLWLSEADAVEHLFRKQRDTFYQAEKVAIDPPKGNFTSIAVCGMSGAVLGPPNHHAYPAALRKLYLDRFSDMPFEAFKNRVRLVKDEAVLTQWKDQQSWKTEYVLKGKNPSPAVTPKPEATAAPSIPAEEITPSEPSEPAPAPEATEAADIGEAIAAPIENAPEAAPETQAAAPVPADDSVRLPNLEAVRAHFIAEHQASQIKAVNSGILSDLKARQQSDPLIQKVIRRAWDSEVRFPAKTGPALIHSLSKNGLQFFKWNKGITHVASVRPKRFDPSKSPVAEGVSKILDWVAAHPGKTRTDLLKALAPESETAPVTPVATTPATPVVPAAATEISSQTAPAEVPAAAAPTPVPAPEIAAAENSQPNTSSILSDLHWLLHEGYVVEFANNQLDLLRQNEKPAQEKKPAGKPAAPIAPEASAEPEVVSEELPEKAPEA